MALRAENAALRLQRKGSRWRSGSFGNCLYGEADLAKRRLAAPVAAGAEPSAHPWECAGPPTVGTGRALFPLWVNRVVSRPCRWALLVRSTATSFCPLSVQDCFRHKFARWASLMLPST